MTAQPSQATRHKVAHITLRQPPATAAPGPTKERMVRQDATSSEERTERGA